MRPHPRGSDTRRGNRPFPPGGTNLPEALRTARFPRIAAVGGIGALLVAIAATAGPALRAFLDFGVGVLTLVSLTSTVVWGLISTDQLVLGPRQRLMTQGIHRALGVAAVCFLVLHVTTKIAEGHATLASAFIPFGITGQAFLIALGSFSAYLMILAAVTGALRSAFAERRHPVRWRILHCTSYASWCAALVHGLNAGRPANNWVIIAYVLCLVAVAAALIYRLRTTRGEDLFPLRAADNRRAGRGGSHRAEPTQRTDGIQFAYNDPLPPLPNFPPVAPPADSLAGLPPVYAEPLPADATAQLPPVPDQAPYQAPYQVPYYETPPYGTQVPYGESADVSATRLQPVNWQQPAPTSAPGPYYNSEGQR